MQNIERPTYHSATGPIEFTLLNDYMFHIVFQDTRILTGLLCALLRLKPEQIRSVVVTNPIEPGQSIGTKTFVLDIHIVLNDSHNINLELQVEKQDDWPERSLNYLCRTFDNLYQGENYKDTRAAIHIGILDFTLFPEHPEFYAVYKLENVKNHHIYSDKFQLNVLDLNQIELATEEDKAYGLDRWAALFKATTWEEINMIAVQNPTNTAMSEAVQKMCEASYDLWVQDNLRAQRKYEKNMERLAQLEDEVVLLQDKNTSLQDENLSLQDENAGLRKKLAQYESQQK